MLLVAALLFVRSFRNLMTFDPGMREGGITVAFLGYWQSNLPPQRWAEFQRELLDEVRATPGVLDAATTTNTPLNGSSWEHGVRVGAVEGNSKFTWVSPGYFNTMGIPVVRGRGFNQNDTAASTRVAVVNQTFVRKLLAGADPIGQTLRTGRRAQLSVHGLRNRRRHPRHAIQRPARRDAAHDLRARHAIPRARPVDRDDDPFERAVRRPSAPRSNAGSPPGTRMSSWSSAISRSRSATN